MEFRRIKPEDYKDIHALNEKLGYSYDGDKVYERIISILETGSDFTPLRRMKAELLVIFTDRLMKHCIQISWSILWLW